MDLPKLLLCARLCKVASKLPGELASIPGEIGTVTPLYYDGTLFSNESIHAYMWICEYRVYLVFHGARHLVNKLTPMDSKHRYPFDSSKPLPHVHRGYQQQFSAIEHHIFSDLQKQESTKGILEINVCGHGFGGALATLAAAHFARFYANLNRALSVNCYTFGSPRVGNTAFASWFKKYVDESFRIAMPGDVIIRTPAFGYIHVGKKVILDKDTIQVCSRKDTVMPFRLITSSTKAPISPSHSVDTYITALLLNINHR